MDQDGSEDGSEDEEDEEENARASKKSRMVLDSDEVAFASSMRPIRPTSGATSQYHQEPDNESEDGDVPGQQDDRRSDIEHEMPEPSDDGEDDQDQEQFGFQDNGVCFHNFDDDFRTYCSHLAHYH